MAFAHVAIFFAFILGLLFLYAAREVLVLLFIAFIIASALRAPAAWLERWMPHLAALLILYLGMVVLLVALVALVVPILVAETAALVEAAPGYWDLLMAGLEDMQAWMGAYPLIQGDQLVQIPTLSEDMIRRLVAVPLGIFSGLLGIVGVLALSFYWLLGRDTLLNQISRLVPVGRRRRLVEVLDRVEHKLGAYVRGQLLVVAIVGVLTFLGLTLLGVRHALLLAVLAAMLEVVPMIGPVVAAIPAILLAATQSLWLGVAVLIFYIVLQQVESYLIYPKVQEMAVHLNPFWTLLSILLGGSVMGILGAVIGVPLAVVMAVLLQELTRSGESKAEQQQDVSPRPVVRQLGAEASAQRRAT